jgi:hypothetical protein
MRINLYIAFAAIGFLQGEFSSLHLFILIFNIKALLASLIILAHFYQLLHISIETTSKFFY